MSEKHQYSDRTFSGLNTFQGPKLISDLSLVRCSFDNCAIPPAYKLEDRVTVQNVVIEKCTAAACFVSGAILSDITVNHLATRTRTGFYCFGTFFKHVVLAGRLGFLKFNAECHRDYDRMPRQQAIWNEAYRSFYKTMDWALDIQHAEFTSGCDFHFVPGRLVRRNPATQVLVTRERLMAINWRSLDWGGSAIPVDIQWFLERSIHEDCVIAAPTKSRRFDKAMFGIDVLRKSGLAEPD